MILALKIFLTLALIIIIILFVLRPRKKEHIPLPENFRDTLNDYVKFYVALGEEGKKRFEDRMQKFLLSVTITGVNADVEDLDRILIGAAAIIPVYYIPDWEYVNLREILVYPGNFNMDFDQHGQERSITGMVGTGAMQNMMILSKWELRQGFLHTNDRNVGIHEFVHLIDKMDGALDGVPEILLERRFVPEWKQLIDQTVYQIRQGISDIDHYGGTNAVECFAVISEYFFENPELFRSQHPELSALLQKIYIRNTAR